MVFYHTQKIPVLIIKCLRRLSSLCPFSHFPHYSIYEAFVKSQSLSGQCLIASHVVNITMDSSHFSFIICFDPFGYMSKASEKKQVGNFGSSNIVCEFTQSQPAGNDSSPLTCKLNSFSLTCWVSFEMIQAFLRSYFLSFP